MSHNKKTASLFLLLIFLLLILELGEYGGNSKIISALLNFGHVPLFGIISIVLFHILINMRALKTCPVWANYVGAFILTSALGAISELIQIPMPRNADVMDLVLDMAGAAGFLLILASRDKALGNKPYNSRLFLLVGISVLAISMVPLMKPVLAMAYRNDRFPLISGFENYWVSSTVGVKDGYLQVVPTPGEWGSNSSKRAARVLLMDSGTYPGIHIEELYGDWSDHKYFAFDIFNPEDSALLLSLRIHDRLHTGDVSDRYSKRFTFPSGAHKICIPLDSILRAPDGRLMRLDQIAGIILFSHNLAAQRVFYIDNIALQDICD